MKDYLVENLRGMCAFPTPYGRCDRSRELRDFCTACYAAAEIERLRVRDEHANASIEARNKRLSEIAVESDRLRAALRDLIDAIPETTLAADPPLDAWVRIAEDVLGSVGCLLDAPVVASSQSPKETKP